MFLCDSCGQAIGPNVPAQMVIVEIRERTYPRRVSANKRELGGLFVFTDDPGGKGMETVKAIKVCPTCANAGRGDDVNAPEQVPEPA